jgi:hypothetical protein
LLPLDLDIFIELIKHRPGASTAFYLTESFHAEPELFSSRLGDEKKLEKTASSFWPEIRKTANIINAANIVGTMPVRVRARFMKHASIAVLSEWVRVSEPADAVNLCRLLRADALRCEPSLITTRDTITSDLAESIFAAPITSLSQIPLRLRKMRAASDPVGIPLMSALLTAALRTAPSNALDWDALRRVVCDVWAFSPLQHEAAEIAARIVDENYSTGSAWPLLCLAGIAEVQQPGSMRGRWPDTIHSINIPNPVDRWQLYLVAIVIGAQSASGKLPRELRDAVMERFPPDTRRVARASATVVERVRSVLNAS